MDLIPDIDVATEVGKMADAAIERFCSKDHPTFEHLRRAAAVLYLSAFQQATSRLLNASKSNIIGHMVACAEQQDRAISMVAVALGFTKTEPKG